MSKAIRTVTIAEEGRDENLVLAFTDHGAQLCFISEIVASPRFELIDYDVHGVCSYGSAGMAMKTARSWSRG